MNTNTSLPNVAIACGGTGGHLFPGLAVADELVSRGCNVALMVSPKDVDQHAVKNIARMEIVTLPAVALTRGGQLGFLRGFVKSYRLAKKHFKDQTPDAVLAMGGFTSAPPILAAKSFASPTFLHESNTIPGRANRWLSRVVNQAFVGFPQATGQLKTRQVAATGTPVRPHFRPQNAAACRAKLGLDPERPTILVMGGSQGASGINDLVAASLPLLDQLAPQVQWIHLTGTKDIEKVKTAHAGSKTAQHAAKVIPFCAEMDLALGAATLAITRAGASSLAELAAMRVPSVLIPFPAATDNHQFHNARAFAQTGAARLLEQKSATPEILSQMILDLVVHSEVREMMRAALEHWHSPRAAERIADRMMDVMVEGRRSAPVRRRPSPVRGPRPARAA